jgi:hypothetical protein
MCDTNNGTWLLNVSQNPIKNARVTCPDLCAHTHSPDLKLTHRNSGRIVRFAVSKVRFVRVLSRP